jgi:hypothetical protein
MSDFENHLIQKGLNDVLNTNVSSHKEVKERFENKFKITKSKTAVNR